jgi:hypothetical protein
MVRNSKVNGRGTSFGGIDCAIGESFFDDLLRKFQYSEEFAQWLSNQASAANFKSEEADCESAIRFVKAWYFLVFVSCQCVMRAFIGQVSSPIMMSLVD